MISNQYRTPIINSNLTITIEEQIIKSQYKITLAGSLSAKLPVVSNEADRL